MADVSKETFMLYLNNVCPLEPTQLDSGGVWALWLHQLTINPLFLNLGVQILLLCGHVSLGRFSGFA